MKGPSVVFLVLAVLVSTCLCKKWEEPITSSYTSTLNAGQVTSGSNSAATGTATFFYNARTEVLSWRITHNVQNALTADLHGPAAAGQDSTRKPVVSFPSATSPIQGSAKISDEHAVQLMNDLMYVVIHTANNPLGEIRGQVLLAEIEGIVKGEASLSGDKVVEPNTAGKGTGTFTFKFSNLTRVMNWTLEHNVKNASMAHIHGPATAQENGAVLLAFDSPSDARGSFIINDAVEQFLLNGLLYAAVHGPDGEIRGQLDITSVKLGTDDDSSDDGLSGGAVFGIILAVLIAIALAAFLAYFLYQRSRSGQTFSATAASPSHRDRSGGMGVSLLDDAQPV